VILDGVEYLVSVHGFRPVLLLIKRLNKIVSEKRAILILALVPGSLNERDEATLSSECERFYDKRLPPL
ncbi:MAG: DUF835 domain-containing protein, partial [Thaumarchaeota archaeon]|nr:DUF835 domain-containing protein [Nitrososphaerota archaeon]